MPLTEIGKIELLGETFKLGKNGKVSLVRETEDAWGKTRGEVVPLEVWLRGDLDQFPHREIIDRVQALLDELGARTAFLQQQRDSVLGKGRIEKGEG